MRENCLLAAILCLLAGLTYSAARLNMASMWPDVTIVSAQGEELYRGPHPTNFADYPVGAKMFLNVKGNIGAPCYNRYEQSIEMPMQSGHYPEMRRHDDRHYVQGPMGLDQPITLTFDLPVSSWRSHRPVPTPLYLAVTGGRTRAAPAPQTNADEAAAQELVLHANH